MRVYKTPEIRNVAVVGHGASGKTSLVDALAFVASTSKRHGSVKDGTALTDYTPDEIERKYSINLAVAVAEWRDTKLNLIDTPGYLDFTGEALAGVYAADGAVVVVSATGGVEVGTEKVWDYCDARDIPRLFFVSLRDKEHADFERVYGQIKERLTPKVIPVEIPVGEGPEFHGIINLFSKKCHLYKKGTKAGEYDEVDVPAEYQARFEKYSQELIESIAATDDTLLERYLGGEEIGRDEAIAAMKAGMAKGELFPLFCGAAVRNACPPQQARRIVPGPAGAPTRRGAEVGNRRAAHPQVRRRRAAGGAGLQDGLGAACGRRHAVPHLLGPRQERAGRLERAARSVGETEPSLRRYGKRAYRNPRAARGRHRCGRQAARHAYQRHALDQGHGARPAEDPVSRAGDHGRRRGEAARRRRQALDRTAQAARRGSHLPSRVQQRAVPDPHPGTRRAASRDRSGAVGAEVRRPCADHQAQGRLPRDVPGEIGGAGEAQEADRRAWAVRRLLDPHRAAAARLRGTVRG